jgi:hypothetical protein
MLHSSLGWDWVSEADPSEPTALALDGEGKTVHRWRTPPRFLLSDQLAERMNDAGQRALLQAFARAAPCLRYVYLDGWVGTDRYWEIIRATAMTVEFREMDDQEGSQIWERYDQADA